MARALEIVGERWTLLIVRDALHGTTKFDDFLDGLGVSRNVLAARLSKLVDDGILERVPYLERPPRYEYVITAKGRDLAPVLVAFMHWGDTYLAGEDGPPRDIIHNGCGGHVRPSMVCSSCGDEVASQEITLTPAATVAESA